MKKVILSFLVFIMGFSVTAQVPNMTKDQAVQYIKDYYRNYKTGYSTDDKYHLLSNNYKLTIDDCNFTMNFDEYGAITSLKKETKEIKFNFSEIESIEPTGENSQEFNSDYGGIRFIPKDRKINQKAVAKIIMNIEYEVDVDVTTTQLFKAFEVLREACMTDISK